MTNKINDFALLIFRVSISSFMLFGHGLGKLQRLFSGEEIKFLDPFGIGPLASLSLATFAEFFGALLVILGLFTRIGSFSLIITMSVAAFIAHADDPFSRQEKALMFLVSYIFIFFVGPGKLSLQNWISQKLNHSNKLIRLIFS